MCKKREWSLGMAVTGWYVGKLLFGAFSWPLHMFKCRLLLVDPQTGCTYRMVILHPSILAMLPESWHHIFHHRESWGWCDFRYDGWNLFLPTDIKDLGKLDHNLPNPNYAHSWQLYANPHLKCGLQFGCCIFLPSIIYDILPQFPTSPAVLLPPPVLLQWFPSWPRSQPTSQNLLHVPHAWSVITSGKTPWIKYETLRP